MNAITLLILCMCPLFKYVKVSLRLNLFLRVTCRREQHKQKIIFSRYANQRHGKKSSYDALTCKHFQIILLNNSSENVGWAHVFPL